MHTKCKFLSKLERGENPCLAAILPTSIPSSPEGKFHKPCSGLWVFPWSWWCYSLTLMPLLTVYSCLCLNIPQLVCSSPQSPCSPSSPGVPMAHCRRPRETRYFQQPKVLDRFPAKDIHAWSSVSHWMQQMARSQHTAFGGRCSTNVVTRRFQI